MARLTQTIVMTQPLYKLVQHRATHVDTTQTSHRAILFVLNIYDNDGLKMTVTMLLSSHGFVYLPVLLWMVKPVAHSFHFEFDDSFTE